MIGTKIRQLRLDNKIKQISIAKYLEITQPAYSRLESNENTLNAKQILKLAKYYNVTSDYILGIESTKNENYISKKFNKLSDDNKVIISTMMDSLIVTQDMGKSFNSPNKKSNVG